MKADAGTCDEKQTCVIINTLSFRHKSLFVLMWDLEKRAEDEECIGTVCGAVNGIVAETF